MSDDWDPEQAEADWQEAFDAGQADGRAAVVEAAVMLKQAAILLRDIAGALNPRAQAAMPPDIHRRLYSPLYESAFSGLPEDIQAEAQLIVERSDWIAEARRVDSDPSTAVGGES